MMYICYSINDFFVREAGISLVGFFENNPDYGPEEVFFLDYGVHPINKEKIGGIAERYGKRVTWLNAKAVTDPVKREFPNLHAWRGSMAPNAKAFVDEIFPPYVERLLFIDADAVVAGSVRELSEMDMGGAVLGAIPLNWVSQDIKKGRFKLYSGNQVYFNSGVLLYDLNNWRKENCHQMIIDTLHKKMRLKWPDQTLLNNAIPQRLIKALPVKYNYVTHYIHPRQERAWMRVGHDYTDAEIEEAIQHPVIVHYVGGWPCARPWYEGNVSHRQEEYFRYKALSPWKDSPLFGPYKDPAPPTTLMDKWYRWQMKQIVNQPSFAFSKAMSYLYYSFGGVVNKISRHTDDTPSEGIEAKYDKI